MKRKAKPRKPRNGYCIAYTVPWYDDSKFKILGVDVTLEEARRLRDWLDRYIAWSKEREKHEG